MRLPFLAVASLLGALAPPGPLGVESDPAQRSGDSIVSSADDGQTAPDKLSVTVTAVCAGVPAFCDWVPSRYRGRAPKMERAAERSFATMPYYDPLNFARFVRCPVAVVTGRIDPSCPSTKEDLRADPPRQPDNWGKWGPSDQVGTLNYITPDAIRHAAGLVRQGKVISLAGPIEPEGPCGTGAYGKIYRYMIATAQGRGQEAGLAEDHLFTEVHGNSHWDGIVHMYAHGTIYNGYDAETSVTWKGALKNGIQEVSNKVVGRGVLVDVARYKGVRILPGDYLITPDDMEGAARKQGLAFRQGDFIMIHTGWLSTWYEKGKEAFWTSGSPGIGWEVSQWLKKIKAAAVGMDARNVEFMPCEKEAARKIGLPDWQLPIHVELLRNQGMMIGDLFDLRELAADCAADGVYEFMFVGPPLNIIYGTGSPVNPVAIK